METKICRKCKVEKPKSEFYEAKSNKDGLQGICKACSRERSKAYALVNRKVVSEKQKAYGEAHATARSEYNRAYYEANKEAKRERDRKYQAYNKEAICERGKKYREANKEAIKAYKVANKEAKSEWGKKYREANKGAICERGKKYREANSKTLNRQSSACVKTRLKNDPLFALSRRIRILIRISLVKQGYSKKSRTYEILGCSCEQFRAHIEGQFPEGMGWHNRSEWHLDHKFPVSKAVDEAHLIALNHYTNFQPLWAADNIRKRDKILDHLAVPTEIN